MKFFKTIFLSLILSACSTTKEVKNLKVVSEEVSYKIFTLKNPIIIGKTIENQSIHMGGFSGINFKEKRNNDYYFQVLADRGPTIYSNNNETYFALPEYKAQLIIFKTDLENQELQLSASIPLLNSQSLEVSGLPVSRDSENPLDIYGLPFSIDTEGMNLRGLDQKHDGTFWSSDEYMPSIVGFKPSGSLHRRMTPTNGLPRLYFEKQTSEGFKTITLFENSLFAFIPNFKSQLADQKNAHYRITQVDTEQVITESEYVYSLESYNSEVISAKALSKQKMLVLEKNKAGHYLLFLVTDLKEDQLVKKTKILDLNELKISLNNSISDMTLIDENTLAFITNNNYQMQNKINKKNGQVTFKESPSQLLILNFKNSVTKF